MALRFEHVRLSYGLKYNRVPPEKLSSGPKGIVLLILYLGMDTSDSRPLIVDQPDENLDNESIYECCGGIFREQRPGGRLFSSVTTLIWWLLPDSEQTLIATATPRDNGLPHISYQMGALENSVDDGSGIRQGPAVFWKAAIQLF